MQWVDKQKQQLWCFWGCRRFWPWAVWAAISRCAAERHPQAKALPETLQRNCGFMFLCRNLHYANHLLTAAVCTQVLLQGGNVSVPAQSVDVLRGGGLGEEPKGSQVGLGGAEARQVAAWGQVVVEGRRQRGLLVNLQQGAKLKGCRNKRADVSSRAAATVLILWREKFRAKPLIKSSFPHRKPSSNQLKSSWSMLLRTLRFTAKNAENKNESSSGGNNILLAILSIKEDNKTLKYDLSGNGFRRVQPGFNWCKPSADS